MRRSDGPRSTITGSFRISETRCTFEPLTGNPPHGRCVLRHCYSVNRQITTRATAHANIYTSRTCSNFQSHHIFMAASRGWRSLVPHKLLSLDSTFMLLRKWYRQRLSSRSRSRWLRERPFPFIIFRLLLILIALSLIPSLACSPEIQEHEPWSGPTGEDSLGSLQYQGQSTPHITDNATLRRHPSLMIPASD